MKLTQKQIPAERYPLKSPHTMKPEGICIHNTANNASASNEIAYMSRNDSSTSFHLAVDEIEAIQAIPFDRNAWAAGDGDGPGNRKHIHLEICRNTGDPETFEQCERNAAKVVANLLKSYGWDISRVKKHQDFNGKDCPKTTLAKGWGRFLDYIKAEMNEAQPIQVGQTVEIIGTTWATGQSIPNWTKGKAYRVDKVDGVRILLEQSGICSWIHVNDVRAVTQPQPQPQPTQGREWIGLASHETDWSIYKTGGPYTRPNRIGSLNPSKFGGLEYEVKKWILTDVAEIQTQDFGRVAIYVAPSTGARRFFK